jgi:tRNA (uracil-5-)-methyltransferase
MPLSRIRPECYQVLLTKKIQAVKALMSPFSPPEPKIYASTPTGFRLRAEFKMWHEGDDIHFVMFRPENPNEPIILTEFPIADQRIQEAMIVVREVLNANNILRRKLFQVEFLASLAGDLLVTLIYHRQLDQAWDIAAQSLITELQPHAPSVSVIGRSRKQKLVIGNDFVREALSINGEEFRYRQYEQSFSQPNGLINIEMIKWACAQASTLSGDLLELYCGNGNFTLPLSRHFDHVIATELAKISIRAAGENLIENRIENVQLVRLSAEEVTQAITAQRVFRRLSNLPKALDQFNLTTLFVDPPRAGLDEHTINMASQFPAVLYISCNPHTLVQNLETLYKTHDVAQFALFDQFPYTDHMECGMLLKRR